MKTQQEWCQRHGQGEFFLADSGQGEALHCPMCFPELHAELVAIDEGLARKRAANNEVIESLAALVDAVRENVRQAASGKNALRLALKRYDDALERQEEEY